MAQATTTVTGTSSPGAEVEGPTSSGRLTYVLRQHFEYTYDAPVRDLNHKLVVVPRRRHGDQHLVRHSVTVSAPNTRTTHRRDASGNMITRARVPLVPERVEFVLEAVVERTGPCVGAELPAAALADPRMLRPTRLTEPDSTIRKLAASMTDQDPTATAERFCAYVHQAIAYEPGATSVTTTAAQAFTQGRGVCQDAAHAMLALCRAARLPARYVSGHLLGEGGTHAWVEVLVKDSAGARAVPLDPCNGRRADLDYVTVATGRDYTDVAPTSGTYFGAACGTLTATKSVSVTAA